MIAPDSTAPAAERYRQGLPAIDLYIERATKRVPADGRFHLVLHGAIVGSFRSLRGAQRAYRKRQAELGYVPAPAETPSVEERLRHEDVERDLLRSASFWAESHRFSGGGGKLRHR